MILAPRIVYGFLALTAVAAVAAVAQPAKVTVEQAKAEPRETARKVDQQQRRALLRAALKTPPEVAMAREAPASPSRLLSDQERADLRQQLRRQ